MARARSLTEFQRAFPDEASCAAFLFERRWPGGFVCPVCGNGRAAALKSRAYTYECSDCGRQTSITAGTALHRTKLPLTSSIMVFTNSVIRELGLRFGASTEPNQKAPLVNPQGFS